MYSPNQISTLLQILQTYTQNNSSIASQMGLSYQYIIDNNIEVKKEVQEEILQQAEDVIKGFNDSSQQLVLLDSILTNLVVQSKPDEFQLD